MSTESGDAPPFVSVVMPARNAAATIEDQLAALAAQDAAGEFEVVVADNGSTDDTVARVRRWEGRVPGLRVVAAHERAGVAYARNAGIAAVTAELVLCCDADDVADSAWVRTLRSALDRSDAVAGGAVDFRGARPAHDAEPQPFGQAGYAFLPAFIGASFGIRREAWQAIGGFDEAAEGSEDVDFAWRLQLAGFTLVQAPAGFVHYRVPATARAVLRTWYRYGRSQPVLYARFAAHGLERDPARRVVAGWARLGLHSYRLALGGEPRRRWCRDAGRRAGRLVGSVRTRRMYL